MKPISQRKQTLNNRVDEIRAPLLRALPRLPEDLASLQGSSYYPLEARIVNPLREGEWDEWIDSHPENTIFHSSAWARVLAETYNHQPCYLRVCVQGELVALIPMIEMQSLITRCRGVCLPFSDYCSPLLFNSFSKVPVLEKVRQVARERSWSYFEVRGNSIVSEDAPSSAAYYGHRLDLRPGTAELFSHFATSVQRAIRKAERSDLSVSADSTVEAMDDFYLLHARTRRRHGVPPQPRSFFANIQRNIINAGLGFIVCVRSRERVVAAAMFFKRKLNAIYKFGASDERAQNLRANNLVMWKAIELLTNEGVETLHFGRTDLDNEGLRRFKRSWGTREETINYFKFDLASNGWVTPAKRNLHFHNEIFRALPVTINRLAGAMIYPHLD